MYSKQEDIEDDLQANRCFDRNWRRITSRNKSEILLLEFARSVTQNKTRIVREFYKNGPLPQSYGNANRVIHISLERNCGNLSCSSKPGKKCCWERTHTVVIKFRPVRVMYRNNSLSCGKRQARYFIIFGDAKVLLKIQVFWDLTPCRLLCRVTDVTLSSGSNSPSSILIIDYTHERITIFRNVRNVFIK